MMNFLGRIWRRIEFYCKILSVRSISAALYNVSLLFVPNKVINSAYLLLLIQQLVMSQIFFKTKTNLIRELEYSKTFFLINFILTIFVYIALIVEGYKITQYYPLVIVLLLFPIFVTIYSYYERIKVATVLRLEANVMAVSSFILLLIILLLNYFKISWEGVLLLRYFIYIPGILMIFFLFSKETCYTALLNLKNTKIKFKHFTLYFSGFDYLILLFLFQYLFLKVVYSHGVSGIFTKIYVISLTACSTVVAIFLRKTYVSNLSTIRNFQDTSLKIYRVLMGGGIVTFFVWFLIPFDSLWFLVALFVFIALTLMQTSIFNMPLIPRTLLFTIPIALGTGLGYIYANQVLFVVFPFIASILFFFSRVKFFCIGNALNDLENKGCEVTAT